MKLFFFLVYLTSALTGLQCKENADRSAAEPAFSNDTATAVTAPLLTGAQQPEQYLPLLKDKKVGLVVNHTSHTGSMHLADFLVSKHIAVKAIFAPEHGFRGDQADGATIHDGKDPATGIPIISLYGSKKAPSTADLANLDILVFDIQDVGTRFYTYLSTLKYLMDAAAAHQIPLIVLDRPNPNGHYIDGPVLEQEFTSFVGVIPIPVVHGMTLGELGQLINGEKWLTNGRQCQLTVIACSNYTHRMFWHTAEKPSPNLPNDLAVALYPSLCFFEATNVSVGRGTNQQFQIYGSPWLPDQGFSFTPQPNQASTQPPLAGRKCHGADLSKAEVQEIRSLKRIDLSYLINAYRDFNDKAKFFLPGNGFEKLAGTAALRRQIQQGVPESEIRRSWEPALGNFKSLRLKYLIYPD